VKRTWWNADSDKTSQTKKHNPDEVRLSSHDNTDETQTTNKHNPDEASCSSHDNPDET
jgi:hypothetical protein